ncbi:hypothetical protein V6N11_021070 [Hibiscus sabdariffa]|uniref:Uncharacterized protein n=1 Tax=Hibiscus sabdariffa TaxID=183260 RepID=A0ABR1ZB76_9ROSI
MPLPFLPHSRVKATVVATSSNAKNGQSAAASGNLDEFMRLTSVGGGDELGFRDRGGAGDCASDNYWPRQETLVLPKIKSDIKF